MTKRCGKDFRLQIDTGSGWITVGPARSDRATVTNEQVDVTTKPDTPWRQLQECGVRSLEIGSDGVFTDHETITFLMQASVDGAFVPARITSGASGMEAYYSGSYRVMAFERNGEYNGAETYSLTLASFGPASAREWLPPLDGVTLGDYPNGKSLRKLLSDYTGPCIRLRREYDNDEQDFYFGSDGWYDWQAVETWSQGQQVFVSRWYNQLDEVTVPYAEENVAAEQHFITDASGNTLWQDGAPYFQSSTYNNQSLLQDTVASQGGWFSPAFQSYFIFAFNFTGKNQTNDGDSYDDGFNRDGLNPLQLGSDPWVQCVVYDSGYDRTYYNLSRGQRYVSSFRINQSVAQHLFGSDAIDEEVSLGITFATKAKEHYRGQIWRGFESIDIKGVDISQSDWEQIHAGLLAFWGVS